MRVRPLPQGEGAYPHASCATAVWAGTRCLELNFAPACAQRQHFRAHVDNCLPIRSFGSDGRAVVSSCTLFQVSVNRAGCECGTVCVRVCSSESVAVC